MAVIVKAHNPAGLLRKIQEQIEKGHIKTWLMRNSYLTHNNEQWRFKAWMLPKSIPGALIFHIRPPKNGTITNVIYGIYHGRISEMLLAHFDTDFSEITLTSLPISGDIIKPQSVTD